MPEDPLAKSVREFYEVLDSIRWTGASQIAELSQLKLLIGKHPAQARQMFAEFRDPRSPSLGDRGRSGKGDTDVHGSLGGQMPSGTADGSC